MSWIVMITLLIPTPYDNKTNGYWVPGSGKHFSKKLRIEFVFSNIEEDDNVQQEEKVEPSRGTKGSADEVPLEFGKQKIRKQLRYNKKPTKVRTTVDLFITEMKE